MIERTRISVGRSSSAIPASIAAWSSSRSLTSSHREGVPAVGAEARFDVLAAKLSAVVPSIVMWLSSYR
jgi:hypothetical protein